MLSPVQLKSSLEAAVQYNKDLSEEAVAFLAGRGISKEIADKFLLGYIKKPATTHENYQGWLSIPSHIATHSSACKGGEGGQIRTNQSHL